MKRKWTLIFRIFSCDFGFEFWTSPCASGRNLSSGYRAILVMKLQTFFPELFSFPFCLLRQKYGKANSRGSDRIFSYANTFGNVFVLKTGKQRNSRRVGGYLLLPSAKPRAEISILFHETRHESRETNDESSVSRCLV